MQQRIQGNTAWRLALTAVLACLVLAGCGGTSLYSNLDEEQANEVVAALIASGVGADKVQTEDKKGWQVDVSNGDIPRAMQILQARGLPGPHYLSMCDVFQKQGWASSAIEEKGRYMCGLEQELAQTLSEIPGVVNARVHVALPDQDPLGEQDRSASASVAIYQQPGANVRNLETDIKLQVKDGVPGLDDVNKVTVKFYTLNGAVSTAQQGGGATRMSLSALSPMGIGIAAGVVVLLALVVAVFGRLRGRAVEAKAAAPGRVWNG